MAGSIELVDHTLPTPSVGTIVVDFVGDASDGSVPEFELPLFEGRIIAVDTNPDPTATTVALATSAASDDIIDTATPHGFTAGTRVRFKTLTGGTGLSANTPYYVSATSLGAQTFRVSAAADPDTPLGFSADITAGTVTDDFEDAPTDNYDFVLNNALGLDVLGGGGANRDTANTERAAITSGYVSDDAPLTLVITNNSVAYGSGRLVFVYTTDV